jgi:hypothetical protein
MRVRALVFAAALIGSVGISVWAQAAEATPSGLNQSELSIIAATIIPPGTISPPADHTGSPDDTLPLNLNVKPLTMDVTTTPDKKHLETLSVPATEVIFGGAIGKLMGGGTNVGAAINGAIQTGLDAANGH